jgi:hypothetical protein
VIVSGFVNPQILEVCQTVKEMSVKVTDNVGVTRVALRIYDLDNRLVSSQTAYRTAGTNLSGTWANDWAIPCTAKVGQYRVEVQVGDAAGNLTAWSALPNFWVWPSTVEDKAVPVVLSGSVTPATVQVCKNINDISARATDDVGVKAVGFKVVDAAGVTRKTEAGYRKTGTKTDGTWSNDTTISCSMPAGRYTVYAQAIDEWQKVSAWVSVGTVDIVAPVAATPTPTPVVTPRADAAAMVITPYVAASAMRNATRSSVASRTYISKSTYYFLGSILYANGQNSGLSSFGHLLSVSSSTPATCSVGTVVAQDNTGGIFTQARISTLASGNCSILWSFAGTADRAATSTTMNFTIR